jgi:hypothetical protein
LQENYICTWLQNFYFGDNNLLQDRILIFHLIIASDVPIVADIRLAIVGNATMLLIDSAFHNRKSPMSVKKNLVRGNSTQTHPK